MRRGVELRGDWRRLWERKRMVGGERREDGREGLWTEEGGGWRKEEVSGTMDVESGSGLGGELRSERLGANETSRQLVGGEGHSSQVSYRMKEKGREGRGVHSNLPIGLAINQPRQNHARTRRRSRVTNSPP
jgi:hypothetical protein